MVEIQSAKIRSFYPPYYIIPAPHIIVSIKLLEEFGEIFTDAFWVNYPLSMNQLEHEISRRVNCKIER
jgi:hypothetical protein